MQSHETFTISLTEALLLGLCTGEYFTRLANPEKKPRFIDILQSRVAPHVPLFGTWNRDILQPEEIPFDIVWSDDGLGYSESNPRIVYDRDNGQYFSYSRERQRSSFFDLLVNALQTSLHLSLIERIAYQCHSTTAPKQDDPTTIIKYIEQLTNRNNVGKHFEIGQSFGRLLATIDGFTTHALDATDPMHLYEKEIYIDLLDDVSPPRQTDTLRIVEELKDKLVPLKAQYAKTSLGIIKNLKFKVDSREQPDPFYTAAIKALEQAKESYMCFWLAFGEVLGLLRDSDTEILDKDSSSVMPRAFHPIRIKSPDDVIKQIKIVEHDLSIDPNLDPKDTISRLCPITEAIAKSIWPNRFFDASTVGLAKIFTDITHDKKLSEAERRFASIGRTLQTSYRNQIAHDFASAKFSISDARFFVSAIRLLADLWQEILNNSDKMNVDISK